MNCANCGAPLQWQPGRRLLQCAHCESYRQPLREPEFVNRLEWQGVSTGRACPTCGAALEAATLEELPAAGCRACSGVLLNDDVFAEVVRARRAKYRGVEHPPTPIDAELFEREIDCPGCGRPMEVHPFYGPGNQVIDSCLSCRLIWVDSGELAAIEQAPGRR
jgi:LSD1 subclass zinc finger protein